MTLHVYDARCSVRTFAVSRFCRFVSWRDVPVSHPIWGVRTWVIMQWCVRTTTSCSGGQAWARGMLGLKSMASRHLMGVAWQISFLRAGLASCGTC